MRTLHLSIAMLFVSVLVQASARADLVHRYLFEVDGRDSVGGAHATFVNGATIQNGAVHLDANQDQYVSMPIGATMGNLGSEITIETWVHVSTLNSDDYYRVFDLGSGTGEYISMTPNDHTNQRRFFLRDTTGTNEQHPFSYDNGEHLNHMVLTIESGVATFYVNGVAAISTATAFDPGNLGHTTRNWLGRSQFPADPYLNGYITEFNIYTHALSTQHIWANYKRGSSVPEPGSIAVAGLFAIVLGAGRRSRR